jgi:hypothetical protein
MTWCRVAIAVLLSLTSTLHADERPVSFRREVIPLLTKHGCATGACHGSPSGKGGFRLSLRGFDAEFDETTLLREAFGRRVNTADSASSLLLRKPLMQIAHGGGRKLSVTDPGHAILSRWIEQGCPVDAPSGNVCRELMLGSWQKVRQWPDVRFSLSVTARFEDGTESDVTELADFTSTEETVATVSAAGEVQGLQRGETTIVVRYLDQLAVAPVTILKPVDGFEWTDPPVNNEIDRLLFTRQRQLQIIPSDLCTDGEFIRRLYLDLLGVLPTADEALHFQRDSSPNKRSALIERVLQREEYSLFWALKWGDLLQVKSSKLSSAGVAKFHQWLVRALRDNRPYDQFASELLTAQGSTFENPAANFYRAATDVDACSEAASQIFLGIRIQCAKCHNHPYERWTQDHYYGLGAFFRRVQRRPDPESEELTIWLSDSGEVTQPRTGQTISPLVPLDGIVPVPPGTDRRVAFAAWLVNPKNPFFAKVGVNRIWAHVMGRGLVDPVDDFRDSNPAAHPELLDWLAGEFVTPSSSRAAFDQKHILRLILNSRTYQLSSRTNRFNEQDRRLFSHSLARPLTAEPLLDAICTVTGVSEKYAGLPAGTRAIELPGPDVGSDFLKVFGQPARNTVCDCERSREPKLSQALQLLSGDFIHKKLVQKHSRLMRHLDQNAIRRDVEIDLPTAGLQLWLRADAGVQTVAGVDAVDGDPVSIWRDQSAHARTVVQAESLRQPVFVTKGIRNRPALRFDGGDLLHAVGENLTATGGARTVVVVAQAGETSSGGAVFTFRRSTPVCTLQHVLYAGTYYSYSDGVNSSGNATIPNAIDTIRQPFVTAFASTGAGQKLIVWLNGQRQAVTQPGAVEADAGSAGFTIGNREDHPDFGWNGLIGEVIVYDRVLADEEMQKLSRQLSLRYSVDSPVTPRLDPPTAETDRLDRPFLTDLYLAAFSREPSSEEMEVALQHLRTVNDRREGLSDLMWAVLNSRELLFQH